MVAPGFEVHVEPCLVLAVRSPFVVAFPSDWLAVLAFGSEMGDAALDSQDLAHAPVGD